jgi:hypothetical protein
MDRRRLAVWLMLAGVALTGVFAFLGSRPSFWLFAVLLLATAGFHWAYACRRCSNRCCGFNARGECFAFGRGAPPPAEGEAPEERFSNLDANVAGLPLVFVVIVGLCGAWLYSPFAVLIALALLVPGVWLYSDTTCRSCGNRCPFNRNKAFREWSTSASVETKKPGAK